MVQYGIVFMNFGTSSRP